MLAVELEFATVQAGLLEPRQLAEVQSLLIAQQGGGGMFLLKHNFYWNISKTGPGTMSVDMCFLQRRASNKVM